MITQTVTVAEKNAPNIIIGRRGTYNTEEIVFDLTYLVETFGSGSAVMMVKRPMDNTAYPAVTEQDGNTLTWTVSDIDTNFKGHGECELFWYVDDGLAKSLIWPLTILRDIGTTTEEPPEPYPTWIDSLTALGAETLQNAQDAAQSASEAEQSATDAGEAKNAAEIAADRAEDALEEFTTPTASATTIAPDSAATASYSNGHFTFGIPKGDKGDPGDPATNLVTSVNGKTGAVVLNATDVGAYVKPSGGIPKSDLASSVQTSLGKADTALQSAPVTSVNNKTGAVVLSASDVGAKPASYEAPVSSVNEKTGAVVLDSEDIRYDSTETYSDGTVGKELGTINSALSSLSSVTEIIDTASGAIASFPDGAGTPMRSLVAEINPVQDLHGYDNPWPAGGGVNKLDLASATAKTVYGFATTKDETTGLVTISGTYTGEAANVSFSFLMTVPYIADATPVALDMNASLQEHLLFPSTPIRWGNTTAGNIAIDLKNLVNGIFYTFTLKPMICANSVTPTAWSPYANECPITGWTGLSGKRTGFNVWDETFSAEGKYISSSGAEVTHSAWNISSYIPVKPDTEYYFKNVAQSATSACLAWYDASKTFISATNIESSEFAKTSPSNAAFLRTTVAVSNIGAVSINYPSTDASYHAYTGEPISVSWQDTAGTVYGGTATYNGDGTWTLVADRLNYVVDGVNRYISGTTYWNIYPQFELPTLDVNTSSSISRDEAFMCSMSLGRSFNYNSGASFLYTLPSAWTGVFDTADEMNNYCKETPIQFALKLANPQTYTITTGELIDTLLGQNNIWVDTGSVEVTYPADTKLYIDKKITELGQ